MVLHDLLPSLYHLHDDDDEINALHGYNLIQYEIYEQQYMSQYKSIIILWRSWNGEEEEGEDGDKWYFFPLFVGVNNTRCLCSSSMLYMLDVFYVTLHLFKHSTLYNDIYIFIYVHL